MIKTTAAALITTAAFVLSGCTAEPQTPAPAPVVSAPEAVHETDWTPSPRTEATPSTRQTTATKSSTKPSSTKPSTKPSTKSTKPSTGTCNTMPDGCGKTRKPVSIPEPSFKYGSEPF